MGRKSRDMTHKKTFVDWIQWWTLRPDTDHKFMTAGYGKWHTDQFAVAAVSDDQSLAVFYLPDVTATGAVTLNYSGVAGNFILHWYDPSAGRFVGEAFRFTGGASVDLPNPPGANSAGKRDWVGLVTIAE